MPAIEQLDDAVLSRLAASREADGPAFLAPHHVAAANRLAKLVERSRLGPRITMSYDATRIGRNGGNGVGETSDSAADARQRLNRIAAALPADCWGVVFDVCGLGKGLQLIETERRWPRRSAKLVLRIGLEQLAGVLGLSAGAEGPEVVRQTGWLEERLPLIAEQEH
ncbi:hypothetical protein GCM10007913_22380 [Devosia yakushimensis]|uniref:DUF6456 domain-containing protein n=1 Tax=Devosia yakushimensis TaxID=470028 RepID=A0ABQ5UEG7_9HYPH|nr:DUF6456 domain-containing protein [Devosia yakushimensis]GLQ10306.1 hypothetical protein GCM10007913_22380 [Devosia yakushimensis]